MEALKLHMSEQPAGLEEGRRPDGSPAGKTVKPDPEVSPRVRRRYLTVAYKLKVLDTVAALREEGQGKIGAYLRKEGLYYSSIRLWETLRNQGRLATSSKGPREKNHDALLTENKQLRRKLEQTEKRLAKTEMIVELQKKLSAILDIETAKPAGGSGGE
jgi:transposase